MRKLLVQIFLFISLCFLLSMGAKANTSLSNESTQRPQVLIVIKDAPDLPFNRALIASIEEYFYAQYPQGKLFYEFLDLAMLPNIQEKVLSELIVNKYKNSHLHAIIYDGIPAISLMQAQAAFKPEASHILLRYSSQNYAPNNDVSSAIIPFELHIKQNYRSLVNHALKITGANKVYLVYDPVNNGQFTHLTDLRENLNKGGLNKVVDLVAFTNLNELVATLSSGTQNAAVILTPILIKSESTVMFPNRVTEYVAANISLPVFVHWDTLLNNEVFGGHVISAQQIGKTTVTGLADALNGRLPRLNSNAIYEGRYNQAELDKRGISLNSLPARSSVYNAPTDFFKQYFTELASAIVLMSCLILFSSILLNRNRLLKKQQNQLYQSEDNLRSSNERLNAATTIAELGIWEYLPDTELFVWDKWMYQHHNQDEQAFTPSLDNWASLLPNKQGVKLKDKLQQAIHKAQDFRFEYALTLINGDARHISLYCHAIVNIDQNTLQLVGTAKDISRQINQQNQLKLERDKARSAVKAKSLFIASMSHEIRNPMNAIIVSSDMLDKSDLNATQAQHNALIKHSAQSMMNIVNDILELAQLENGKMKIERYAFNPGELVLQILAGFRGEITSKNLQLKFDQLNTLPESVVSDPLRIKQVLFNLMANAVKFTHQGHVGISLKYEQSSGPPLSDMEVLGTLIFVVYDSGIGIAEEAQARIFEKFVQSDKDTFKKYGGTGLGLNISRELTHLLGGDLQVISKLGEGSKFVFSVPVKTYNTHTEKPSSHSYFTAPCLVNKTVLIVDDLETNRIILEQALLDTHANIVFASNGQEAVEAYYSQKLDLILMDVLMPDMDGIEATKIIRSSESAHNAKDLLIFSFTAQTREGDKDLCLDAGMDAYLTKPINQRLLFSTILAFPQLSSPAILASSSSFIAE